MGARNQSGNARLYLSAARGAALLAAAALAAAGAGASAAGHDLASLYELALENDARFRASRARYEATALNPAISRARLLPQISLSAARSRFPERKIRGTFFGSNDRGADIRGTFVGSSDRGDNIRGTFVGSNDRGADNRGDNEYTYSVDSYTLSVTQSLFNREYYAELKKSKSQAERARLDFEAERQDLIVRLAEAYFGVLSAHDDLDFARAEKDAVMRQLERAQSRFEAGLDPITDAKKAEAAHDLAVADEISAANQLEVSRSLLRVITGRIAGDLRKLTAAAPVAPPTPNDAAAWIETAHERNLRLLSRQLAVNVAAAEVESRRAGHYPTLDLYADRNERDVRGGPSPQTLRDVEVGLRLNLPLFAGGGTSYRTRQAAHLHREAAEQLKQTHDETRQQAREAFLNVVASVSRVAALAKARESAKISYESNDAGFKIGTRSSVDVLLALEDLFDAERDYSDTRHEYILNTLRLKRAAGSLSPQDVREIVQWLE